MFKSKRRNLVIPQTEHSRLAGIIAQLWGNNIFDRPEMDFNAFVLGVSQHDRGYGNFDNFNIGEGSDEQWMKIQEVGIAMDTIDPAADIVAMMHMRRLLVAKNIRAAEPLVEMIDDRVREKIALTDLDLNAFHWADHITRLCDSIAFAFSFEDTSLIKRHIYSRLGDKSLVTITVSVHEGVISADPWPFSVEDYGGFVFGYESDTYPETPIPVLVPFDIRREET